MRRVKVKDNEIDFSIFDTITVNWKNCKEVSLFVEPVGYNGKTTVDTNMYTSSVIPSQLLTIRRIELIPLTPYPEPMLLEILNAGVAQFRIVDMDMFEKPLHQLLAGLVGYTGFTLDIPITIHPYENFAFRCRWNTLPQWAYFTFKIAFVGTIRRPS